MREGGEMRKKEEEGREGEHGQANMSASNLPNHVFLEVVRIPDPLGSAYVARACAEFHEMLATDAGVRNDWEHHRLHLELANDRFIVNSRMHAWDCWLGDVSSASVAASRAMELAVRDGGEQALAAARQQAASATASMLAVRDGWPAQGPHMAPTRSIPWIYFED